MRLRRRLAAGAAAPRDPATARLDCCWGRHFQRGQAADASEHERQGSRIIGLGVALNDVLLLNLMVRLLLLPVVAVVRGPLGPRPPLLPPPPAGGRLPLGLSRLLLRGPHRLAGRSCSGLAGRRQDRLPNRVAAASTQRGGSATCRGLWAHRWPQVRAGAGAGA